jgi:hypothetical protein
MQQPFSQGDEFERHTEPEPESVAASCALARQSSMKERTARKNAEAGVRQMACKAAALDGLLADVQRELVGLERGASGTAAAATEQMEPPRFQWMYADTNPLASINPLRWSAGAQPFQLAQELYALHEKETHAQPRPISLRVIGQTHTETFPSKQAAADWLHGEGAEQLQPSDVSPKESGSTDCPGIWLKLSGPSRPGSGAGFVYGDNPAIYGCSWIGCLLSCALHPGLCEEKRVLCSTIRLACNSLASRSGGTATRL